MEWAKEESHPLRIRWLQIPDVWRRFHNDEHRITLQTQGDGIHRSPKTGELSPWTSTLDLSRSQQALPPILHYNASPFIVLTVLECECSDKIIEPIIRGYSIHQVKWKRYECKKCIFAVVSCNGIEIPNIVLQGIIIMTLNINQWNVCF